MGEYQLDHDAEDAESSASDSSFDSGNESHPDYHRSRDRYTDLRVDSSFSLTCIPHGQLDR